jgi:hypothetical protein
LANSRKHCGGVARKALSAGDEHSKVTRTEIAMPTVTDVLSEIADAERWLQEQRDQDELVAALEFLRDEIVGAADADEAYRRAVLLLMEDCPETVH